jgi:hypothetical protein
LRAQQEQEKIQAQQQVNCIHQFVVLLSMLMILWARR